MKMFLSLLRKFLLCVILPLAGFVPVVLVLLFRSDSFPVPLDFLNVSSSWFSSRWVGAPLPRAHEGEEYSGGAGGDAARPSKAVPVQLFPAPTQRPEESSIAFETKRALVVPSIPPSSQEAEQEDCGSRGRVRRRLSAATASTLPPGDRQNEKCPCPAAKYHLEILRKRTAQSYEWHGTGRVPLFYANLDRSRGRRVRMDYVLGKTAIRVPGLDQRNVQAWMKHNIFTPDEYLHKYFRSLVPRRPGEFGATLSHLKQVWAAYAWFVKKSFPAMRDKLREEVERLKGHGARASPSSAPMPSSSGTELAASGAGGMGEGIKGSTNSLRGAGTPSEDDYEGGRAAPQVGPATATSSEGALLSTTARPVVGVNSLHSEAEHDVAAQAQVGGGAAQPRNDEHGDMADPSGEGESSAPPGMIGSDVDAPGEDGGPQGQGGAAGHHDDGGGNNRRRLEAADRGSAAAFSGGATRKSTSGSIRRTAHVEKGWAATALSSYDYETSAPGPAVTEISEKPASTPRRGLRSSLTASTRSGASEAAPKNWWFEEPNYRDAEGELVDWTLRMEDDTFFGHLSEADRKFSAMFFEDDTSTASRDIGWGGVTVTDFADALDAYDAKWETLRLGTNNCDEPWRVDIGSKRPFSESVFANDRLECFGATSYMVSLRGMRVLLRKYLVSQRAVAIVGEDVMRKKKLLVEQGPGAVNAGWGEELIVLRVTDDSCKQFWCRGNQYCLQELQREYSKPVKRLCDEKIESLKQEAAAYRVQLETDAVLLQSDPAKKQALQNRLERAENARRWNVDRCAGVMREKVAAFHGCVEKIIPPDPLHVDYRVEARFDVPKFNLTSFRGIYPVADVLIFQEALNAKTAYRLLHNYIFESIFEIEPVLSHGHIPTALDDEFAKAGMVSTLKAREKVLNWMVDVVEESPASWTTTTSGGAAGGAGGGTSATPTTSSSMLTLPSSAATNKEEFHDEHTHQEWHWLLKRGAQRADWVGEEPCVYFLNLDRSRRRRKRMRLLLGEKGRRVRALDHYDAERWKRMSQPDTPEELATIKPTRHNRIGEHALTLSHLLAVYQGFADYVKAWGATRATGQGGGPGGNLRRLSVEAAEQDPAPSRRRDGEHRDEKYHAPADEKSQLSNHARTEQMPSGWSTSVVPEDEKRSENSRRRTSREFFAREKTLASKEPAKVEAKRDRVTIPAEKSSSRRFDASIFDRVQQRASTSISRAEIQERKQAMEQIFRSRDGVAAEETTAPPVEREKKGYKAGKRLPKHEVGSAAVHSSRIPKEHDASLDHEQVVTAAPAPSPDNEGNHILQESRQHQRLSGQELEYLKQKYFPKILHAAEDDPTMDDLHVLLEDYAANAAEDEKGNRHDDVLSAAGASKEAASACLQHLGGRPPSKSASRSGKDDRSRDDQTAPPPGVATKPSPRGRRLQQQSAAFNSPPSTPRAANLASSPQLQFHEQILEHLALPEPQFLAKAAEKNLQNYAMTLVEDDISTGSHDIGWGRVTLTDLRDAIRRYDDKWETLRLGTSNCDPPGGSWNASFVLFVPDANVRNCYGAVAYMTSLLGMRRLLKKYLVDVEDGGGKKNGEVAAARAHVVDQQHSLFSPKFDVTRFEGAYPVADLLMFSNPHAWRVQTAFLFESVFEPDPVLRHGHVKRDREEALVIDGIMNSYRAREQGIDIRLNVWT